MLFPWNAEHIQEKKGRKGSESPTFLASPRSFLVDGKYVIWRVFHKINHAKNVKGKGDQESTEWRSNWWVRREKSGNKIISKAFESFCVCTFSVWQWLSLNLGAGRGKWGTEEEREKKWGVSRGAPAPGAVCWDCALSGLGGWLRPRGAPHLLKEFLKLLLCVVILCVYFNVILCNYFTPVVAPRRLFLVVLLLQAVRWLRA